MYTQIIIKKEILFLCSIRVLNLTLNELKLVAKSRGIRDYENKSENDLILNELKLVAKSRGIRDYENKSEDDLIKLLSEPETETSLSKKKIRDIRKDFNKSRHKFSKSKIKEIKKKKKSLQQKKPKKCFGIKNKRD